VAHTMKKLIFSNLTALFILSLAGTACASPAATALPTETPTPTTTPAPTATQTLIPSSTPTPEPEKPSVPNSLRPENAASQTLENGVWTVKNADGKVTATWNTETQTWTYSPENIKIKQTIIGNDVDRSIFELFLGPLPPDDPSTHFKDENGNPVEYGIEPEIMVVSFGRGGKVSNPATEIFARFRGVVSIGSNLSATILEVPRSPDTSVIIVTSHYSDEFGMVGTPNDSAVWNQYTNTLSSRLGGAVESALANENLPGQMVIVLLYHDTAPLFEGTDKYTDALQWDKNAKAYLATLSGTSPQAVLLDASDILNGFPQFIVVPDSHLPKP
jgi:hypothetical protein